MVLKPEAATIEMAHPEALSVPLPAILADKAARTTCAVSTAASHAAALPWSHPAHVAPSAVLCDGYPPGAAQMRAPLQVRTLSAHKGSVLHEKLNHVPALELDCGSMDIVKDQDARKYLAEQVRPASACPLPLLPCKRCSTLWAAAAAVLPPWALLLLQCALPPRGSVPKALGEGSWVQVNAYRGWVEAYRTHRQRVSRTLSDAAQLTCLGQQGLLAAQR